MVDIVFMDLNVLQNSIINSKTIDLNNFSLFDSAFYATTYLQYRSFIERNRLKMNYGIMELDDVILRVGAIFWFRRGTCASYNCVVSTN